VTHSLKCWAAAFDAIERGEKRADVRRNDDRDFQVGDVLELIRWDHDLDKPTGRRLRARVTHATIHAGDLNIFGIRLKDGDRAGCMTLLVVLSIEVTHTWEAGLS
jgi:hypothetical protein